MSFNKPRHLKYWRMCANALPDAYQSSDASRLSLGFFIVAALDLLGLLHSTDGQPPRISASERQGWIDWIYSCQVPDGAGFRGFPGTDLADRRSPQNQEWDPGNLPNTFFALVSLLTLGDDLSRVRRDQHLAWLPRLQRPDGSFGEFISAAGVEGGRDLRFCCCAAGIAYILQGSSDHQPSMDQNALISYILNCQQENGGFGESPFREPHSGLGYCAIATLELLSRTYGPGSARARRVLMENKSVYIRWMLDRQTTVLQEEQSDDGSDEDKHEVSHDTNKVDFADAPMFYSQPTLILGFNGRENKIADTCYCFWNSAALAMLDAMTLADTQAVRQYLLDKVQHMIGGFAKDLESPPDVLHSCLGLATLSLYGQAGVDSLDPALCISKRAAANLALLSWRQRHADHPKS